MDVDEWDAYFPTTESTDEIRAELEANTLKLFPMITYEMQSSKQTEQPICL